MASFRPSHRYAAADSSSSSDPKSLSSMRRLAANSSGHRSPSDPIASAASSSENTSRALASARDAKSGHSFGSMVRKFIEKRPNQKSRSAERIALAVPPDPLASDVKNASKGSHFTSLSRKLFQKGGTAEKPAGKALTDVKTNTRTLAMVLRSEKELLAQNKEYEAEISELRLLIEEKDKKIEKLKDLCLKQREEVQTLKHAILFPDTMNSQLGKLLEKQDFELKQAKQVIPSLQKQVTSLTGQLQCLADDLAEVKADKYPLETCFDGPHSSPRTPFLNQKADNSLEYYSGDLINSEYGSPDDMFLKDLNPCLTPCFSKTKSQENKRFLCDSPKDDTLFQCEKRSPNPLFVSRGVKLSRSSEHRQRPNIGGNSALKVYKSDENKHPIRKPR